MATLTIPQYQRDNIASQITNAAQMLALVAQNKGVVDLALILERDRNAGEVRRLQAQKAADEQRIAALILKIEELTTTLARS